MLSGLSSSSDLSVDQLLEKFSSGSSRQKRSLIPAVEKAADQLAAMGAAALASFDREGDEWAAGWILQALHRHQPSALSPLFNASGGWFAACSESDLDYSPLQQALLEERFEEADRLTSAFLRQLAGEQAERRGYVYFSEVLSMRGLDLVTMDRLWIAYSQGRFGFTVQARLLATLNGRYDKLWPRIGWKQEGVWTRYPNAFDWSLTAPEGHMPLVNQLRGVRLIDALLNHPSLVARQ
ncbi:MAG: GUN4 domain-containing protein [Synechococcus sp.]|uniref:GUN4 domain-containing protein n=1 Tax=Synechococcus sp. PROS-9-1 TaxID=1968775 RepID=UPI000B6EF5F7|nr:GUN4 domain-containing protein [Synechococcus sp. PROS-9-1]MBL6888236.1 GUN4 domain-containing protein [Synechococcus sp. BS30m-G30]QNJ31887.1 ferredoxin-interacting protein Ycf53 [Synechococcus sp. PROS-9-1]RCL58219.1 MAG: GUN4 domain-containing protein [Synechococcus sp. MED-G68]|tara:strand:- start:3571 stop:4284 length:714 start_codon:yes stop_codon:yes gene_type:complete